MTNQHSITISRKMVEDWLANVSEQLLPPVATDKEILKVWHKSNTVSRGLRDVYNLGRGEKTKIAAASDSQLHRIWIKYSGDIIDPLREIYDLGRCHGDTEIKESEQPSLKKQALEILGYPKDLWNQADVEIIRSAVKSLDD